jgi:hypothetical protein
MEPFIVCGIASVVVDTADVQHVFAFARGKDDRHPLIGIAHHRVATSNMDSRGFLPYDLGQEYRLRTARSSLTLLSALLARSARLIARASRPPFLRRQS